MLEHPLPMGIWHTAGSWLGIKVEWEALENNSEKEVACKIHDLFVIANHNFR